MLRCNIISIMVSVKQGVKVRGEELMSEMIMLKMIIFRSKGDYVRVRGDDVKV